MEIVLLILAFIFLLVGLLGAVVPILPGPPLSFLGLLLLQWSGFAAFPAAFLWIWAGITLVVTLMDYHLPALLARKFGGSKAAAIGSFLGLIIGMFFFPPFGMVIGSFIGAFLGEIIQQHSDGKKALKAAFGAFIAFILSTGAKLITCGIMIFFAVRALTGN